MVSEQQIEIDIPNPDELFTPVYWALNEAETRFVANYGGTGSSKSYSSAQNEVLKACEKKELTLVIRKVADTIRDSVWPSFINRINEIFAFDKLTAEEIEELPDNITVADIWHLHKSDRTITNLINGSQFVFRGLDKPDKIKSIEGLTRIVVEEAAELEEADFFELNRRIRGRPNIQITLNFNPIHENHWLKKRFFDREDENVTIIHSTYRDNPFLTDEDRAQIEQMRLYDYNQYRVYALGEWGITGNDNPWLFHFRQDTHVGEPKFMPSYPVYLSFDFNREPASCLAFQMSPIKGDGNSFIHCIKEFVIDGQLHELCERIKATYPISILYVTGDASGNRGDVGFTERHATYYSMIQGHLKLSKAQMNINKKNLEHSDSRNLCNTMLYSYPNILIHKDCKFLLNDIQIATVDDKKLKPGMLKKDRDIYKMDVFDCYRYFFQTYFLEFASKVYLKGITKE